MEDSNDTILIGNRNQWGIDAPVGLTVAERRQHLYVVGQTGTGKSTLLRNLIIQDIEAGRGVGLVDPHGDLALEILGSIPSWRTDDVVYFDPTSNQPLAINLFRSTKDNWHLVASGIVSAFKKVWGDSWDARLEYILFATLAALIQCDNSSLLGVSRMLYDSRYRAWVVRQVKDPMVRSFWVNEFENYDRKFLQEVISPVQNKVGQLLFSPIIRNTLGQVGTKVNFRYMMDNRKIFIANLCKGYMGSSHSNLLGSLLVTAFEIAALSRSDIPQDTREDFFLYVDEFQNCATESFVGILSEARKYRLCLTLAHQYVDQLDEEIAKAIFGNAGSLITFRVGESDAEVLERQFGNSYTRSQLAGLNNFNLCAKLLNGQPFMGTSFPPLSVGRQRQDIVIKRSREKYGTKQEIIEDKIDRWLKHRF